MYLPDIRALRLLSVALAAVAVFGGCGAGSSGQEAEPVGEIAYTAWDGEQHAIYVVRTDGSGLGAVVRGANGRPAWSPDGTQLAFVRCDPATEDDCTVFVLELEKRTERKLARIDFGEPAWSPEGTELALVRCDEDAESSACAVFVVPADGGTPQRVTKDGLAGQPVWSPDARRIAFTALRRGIFVFASDGSGVLWSTFGDGDPAWSPDGRQLAFMRGTRLADHEVRYDLYVIDADGTGSRRISDGTTNNGSPSWSPDGSRLAFEQWTGHSECPSAALFVAERDGSKPRRLTPYRPLYADSAWSPDGRQIAVARIEKCSSEENPTLWLVSVEGSEAAPLSPPVRLEPGVGFAWRPGS